MYIHVHLRQLEQEQELWTPAPSSWRGGRLILDSRSGVYSSPESPLQRGPLTRWQQQL